jgi:hypothetical protein
VDSSLCAAKASTLPRRQIIVSRTPLLSFADVADWLKKLGMSEYAQLFADNSIDDVSILRDLSDQDLKDVGLPLGHRRKMLRAIAELFRRCPVGASAHNAARAEASSRR